MEYQNLINVVSSGLGAIGSLLLIILEGDSMKRVGAVFIFAAFAIQAVLYGCVIGKLPELSVAFVILVIVIVGLHFRKQIFKKR